MGIFRKKPAGKLAASSAALEKELKQVSMRLDTLIARAREAEESVRAATIAQLRSVQTKQLEAKKHLARLARQTAAASGPIKRGLENAWRDIDKAVHKAAKRFRKAA